MRSKPIMRGKADSPRMIVCQAVQYLDGDVLTVFSIVLSFATA